jgi:hypothetical protein
MRHVFTDNSTIALLWATEAQHHARNRQHNFYFTGTTIYSYGEHFPIATFEERFGRKFIIYNTRTYSVTTNGHQSTVYWVIRRHLAAVPLLKLPLHRSGVAYTAWLCEQKAIIHKITCDLTNQRKINTPTKEDFDEVINRLNEAEYYLFDHTDPYCLDDFIRAPELDLLLQKAEERKTFRESKQKLRRAFGCSDHVASTILAQAKRKAA